MPQQLTCACLCVSVGQVDFLPTKAMTPEELQRQREQIEAMAKATRIITTVSDGQPSTIELFIKMAFKTRGGYMFDVAVTYEERETQHRVIVGQEYYEGLGIEPEAVLDRVFAFLIRKRVPRRTEGVSAEAAPCVCGPSGADLCGERELLTCCSWQFVCKHSYQKDWGCACMSSMHLSCMGNIV